MGITTILFNVVDPFEQTVNIPSTEGPMWNLVKVWSKSGQVVSEKIFKDFMMLYLYLAQGQGQMILTKKFYYLNHKL